MQLKQFVKNFTLPLSITTGILIYLIFAFTPGLESAADFFAPIMAKILPLFMFLILFVVFCKVDFHQMRPVRWHLPVVGFQLLFVGLLTAAIMCTEVNGKTYVLLTGLLACIIGPVAAASSVITAKLGGKLETMTTYTFISNTVTAITIPLIFPLFSPQAADLHFLDAFIGIFYKVCMVLLVPMIGAYIVKHFFKRFHRWVIGVKDLSFYMWGGSLLIVSGTTVKNIVHAQTSISYLLLIAIASLGICLLQFSVGRHFGRRLNHVVECGQALGQKNTPFAIWVAITYLHPLACVAPGCYILWQNIVNSAELYAYERRNGTLKQP